MLNFPTCPGNIPRVLRWYNPHHYVVLAYWIYFRPTALKCYFHQALPELYNYKAPPGFFRRWGNPSYRNLFLMVPTVALVLSFTVGMFVTSFSAWLLQVEVNWPQWQDGLGFGVAVGVAVGMAMGMVGSTLGGSALGTLMGITFGVTIGVTGGVSASVAFALEFKKFMDAGILLSAIFGMLAGMAITLDIEIGVAVSLTFLTIGAMSFGAEFIVFRLFGIQFGALLARGMLSGAFIAGAFRVIFYPVQAVLAVFSVLPWIAHPLAWDELPLLPLPWTRTMLLRRLRKDETQGLQFLAGVWRNLFCRPSIQVVLFRYLHKHEHPLRFLYSLLTDARWAAYMLIPLTAQSWENNESVRRVLLGELALRPVEATHTPRFQRSGWWLNLHLYPRRQTPLTQFAGMLYDLLDPAIIEAENFTLTTYERVYSGVAFYPDGKELALSFHAMAQFLAYQEVVDLARAQELVTEIFADPEAGQTLRPTTLTVIRRLGQVGADIGAYRDAVHPADQLAALARAAGALNELSDHVRDTIATPEQRILQRIIQRWQHQILTTIGELGKVEEHAEQRPIPEGDYQI
jgi:hypothetical protein